MSGLHSLPPNPLLHPNHSPSRDPSPPPRGFSRSGFAPIPYRHSELPPPPREREREFPRRDLDPEPEIERWERRMDREDWDRRAPPPHMHSYEDNYGGLAGIPTGICFAPLSTGYTGLSFLQSRMDADARQTAPSAGAPLLPFLLPIAHVYVHLHRPAFRLLRRTTSQIRPPSTLSLPSANSQNGSAHLILRPPKSTRRSCDGSASSSKAVVRQMA
jgi:hypothetical protein